MPPFHARPHFSFLFAETVLAVFQPKFVDLVRNVTVSEGTGPVTPAAAVSGFTGFADALQYGDQFY